MRQSLLLTLMNVVLLSGGGKIFLAIAFNQLWLEAQILQIYQFKVPVIIFFKPLFFLKKTHREVCPIITNNSNENHGKVLSA